MYVNSTVIIMALRPFVGPWLLFSFLILFTFRSSLSEGRPLHRTKDTQTSMHRVGFEPTTPIFDREKTVRASDRAVNVNGEFHHYLVLTLLLAVHSSLI
jgi:hypothetical protein